MADESGHKPTPSEISQAESSMSNEQRHLTEEKVEEGANDRYLEGVEKDQVKIEKEMQGLAHKLGSLEIQKQNIKAGRLPGLSLGQQGIKLKEIDEEIMSLVQKAGNLQNDWLGNESTLDPTNQSIRKMRREEDRYSRFDERAEQEKDEGHDSGTTVGGSDEYLDEHDESPNSSANPNW